MKLVFSSPNTVEVNLMQGVLEVAGIESEIRNENVCQVVPGFPFAAELWVLNDENYDEARRLIQTEATAAES